MISGVTDQLPVNPD